MFSKPEHTLGRRLPPPAARSDENTVTTNFKSQSSWPLSVVPISKFRHSSLTSQTRTEELLCSKHGSWPDHMSTFYFVTRGLSFCPGCSMDGSFGEGLHMAVRALHPRPTVWPLCLVQSSPQARHGNADMLRGKEVSILCSDVDSSKPVTRAPGAAAPLGFHPSRQLLPLPPSPT